MAEDGESLESWLNKATNLSNRQEDWEYIIGFCDQINKELEGPQISVRLLAHKIQSPQEWEALQGLTVLEACMKNCGRRFHSEVGKFKFLNELIKVVSPKYLGERVSEKVRKKVIEMLYAWTVSLPDETKICEAYQMLKSQGIVLVDPEISADATLIPSPSPRPKNPVFDDERKSKRLSELLKSKKPEDLQEANRLIKNMVKEDEVRMQRTAKQKSTLEAVNNSVKLLNEMLAHFSPDNSTEGDKELIKELYIDCDKLRQTVFTLATETEDDDSSLGEILQASDDLSHVIGSYKKIVEGHSINGDAESAEQMQNRVTQGTESTNQSEVLIDLVGIDFQSPSQPMQEPSASSLRFPAELLCDLVAPRGQSEGVNAPSTSLSQFDEELLSLGRNKPFCPVLSDSTHGNASNLTSLQLFSMTSPEHLATSQKAGTVPGPLDLPYSLSHTLQDLAMLDLMSNDLGATTTSSSSLITGVERGLPSPSTTKSHADAGPLLRSLSPILLLDQASPGRRQEDSLTQVFVPLEAIKPSKVCPVTAYDKNGVRLLLHFASNCPPGRPDVLVIVVSMLSTAPQPVRNIVLQAAVPREKVRMRYKLTFMLEEQPFTELGEVNDFPPTDQWGAL
ncbi:unnamed protein product [Menidia menidia]|uniref:(Atlantic silverside) hypothetical protein n=1 Tax=Menidia menidia TaxID=238744 RepID=A0A8S4B9P2_9TELE|nr:unnamed protein product [Menidia menidia]